MKIAILGSGPAGLLIAHAARLNGHGFEIWSAGGPSELHGAQYLHQPIQGIPEIPVQTIWNEFKGSMEEYRKKVYGLDWSGDVSPQRYRGATSAWDIRYAYEWLVKEYWSAVSEKKISGWTFGSFLGALKDDGWKVFNTIPRKQLCIDLDHKFTSSKIWAIGDAPDRGIRNPIPTEPNTVVCSGEKDVSWYRTSNVFGHTTTEWPKRESHRKPPIRGVVEVEKPLTTTCSCWITDMMFMGRYGEWKKGVLTHHVFRDAMDLLK